MPGNASVVRERVLAEFITALAADTGISVVLATAPRRDTRRPQRARARRRTMMPPAKRRSTRPRGDTAARGYGYAHRKARAAAIAAMREGDPAAAAADP